MQIGKTYVRQDNTGSTWSWRNLIRKAGWALFSSRLNRQVSFGRSEFSKLDETITLLRCYHPLRHLSLYTAVIII